MIGLAQYSEEYAQLVLEKLKPPVTQAQRNADHSKTRAVVAQEHFRRVLGELAAWINGKLRLGGCPDIRLLGDDTSRNWGSFNATEWVMRLDKERWDAKLLLLKHVKELAVTLYHESRHAEQHFLMARYVWSKNKKADVNSVAAELKMVDGLEDTDANAIGAARLCVKMTSEERELAKKLYEGEYGKVRKAVRDDSLVASIGLQKIIETHSERIRGNVEFDAAKKYAREVRAEIKAYNLIQPRALPGNLDSTLQFSRELREAHSTPDTARFLNAYHQYLAAKKLNALQRLDEAYKLYLLSALESDAHAVETTVRTRLEMEVLGFKQDLPDPKRWPARSPQPALPPSSLSAKPMPARVGQPPPVPPRVGQPLPSRVGQPPPIPPRVGQPLPVISPSGNKLPLGRQK